MNISLKETLICGLAAFSMSFGAGNTVFPVLVGAHGGDASLFTGLGLMTSDVLLTLLGMIGLCFFAGNTRQYLAPFGKYPTQLILFAIVLLMGPLGIAPRCISVSYAAVVELFPSVPLSAFALGYCALLGYLLMQPSKLLDRVGAIMTPALVIGIALLVYYALRVPFVPTGVHPEHTQAFQFGFDQGLQTLDMIGVFVAMPVIFRHLGNRIACPESRKRVAIRASFLGMGLLALVYIGMLYLGAKHAAVLQNVEPQQLFIRVCELELGRYATPAMALIIVLACLTTVVVAVGFFTQSLHEEIVKEKISRPVCLGLTLAATFGMTLIGFGGITAFLGMTLDLIYPAMAVLAIYNLGAKLFEGPLSRFSTPLSQYRYVPIGVLLGVFAITVLYRV